MTGTTQQEGSVTDANGLEFAHTPHWMQLNAPAAEVAQATKQSNNIVKLSVERSLWSNPDGLVASNQKGEALPILAESEGVRGEKLVLKDEAGVAYAVLHKNTFDFRYEIFGFETYTLAQRPSGYHKDGRPMYLWGTLLVDRLLNPTRILTLVMVSGAQYRATREGRIVGQRFQSNPYQYKVLARTPSRPEEKLAATLRQQDRREAQWELEVAPGIDSILMVALVSMLDDNIECRQRKSRD